MRRRLIKQGNNAYTITLPIEWVRQNNLDAGEDVDISLEENKIVVHTNKTQKKKKTIKLNIEADDYHLFRSVLIPAYTLGFDELIINTKAKNAQKYLEKLTSRYILGFEVVKQGTSGFQLENVSEPSRDKFDVMLRKIFLICMELFNGLSRYIQNPNAENYKEMSDWLDRVEKYTNFCRRIITKNMASKESAPQVWLLVSYLLKLKIVFKGVIVDLWKKGVKLKPEWDEAINILQKNFSELYECFYATDLERTSKVYEYNKQMLNSKIKKLAPQNDRENRLYHHIYEFNRIISYLTSPIIYISISNRYAHEKD